MNSNNEVNNGQTGELCISGPQISRGYLNNPEKKLLHSILKIHSLKMKNIRFYIKQAI